MRPVCGLTAGRAAFDGGGEKLELDVAVAEASVAVGLGSVTVTPVLENGGVNLNGQQEIPDTTYACEMADKPVDEPVAAVMLN